MPASTSAVARFAFDDLCNGSFCCCRRCGTASRSWNTTPAAIWRAGSKAIWCRAARRPTACSCSPAGRSISGRSSSCRPPPRFGSSASMLRLHRFNLYPTGLAAIVAALALTTVAAVARQRAADRHFRRSRRARLRCLGPARRSDRARRTLGADRFHRFCGFDPQRDLCGRAGAGFVGARDLARLAQTRAAARRRARRRRVGARRRDAGRRQLCRRRTPRLDAGRLRPDLRPHAAKTASSRAISTTIVPIRG